MRSLPRILAIFIGVVVLLGIASQVAGSTALYDADDAISAQAGLTDSESSPTPSATPQVSTAQASTAGTMTVTPASLFTSTLVVPLQTATLVPTSTTPINYSAVVLPTPTLLTLWAQDGSQLLVHLPANASEKQPLRVLLVLHGMGGRGPAFAQALLAEADRDNWVVVAPTMPYQANYMDPTQLVAEDVQLTEMLHRLIEELPQRLGLRLRRHALVYGFSRGAQIAHRLALLYPENVETVATISAGSYTMPAERTNKDGVSQVLPLPFGVGDLLKRIGRPVDWADFKRVSFWVGVGEKDNRAGDVARAFDQYCGTTRVERARHFNDALVAIGVDSRLAVFPNADHEITAEMRKAALDFIRADELADHWND